MSGKKIYEKDVSLDKLIGKEFMSLDKQGFTILGRVYLANNNIYCFVVMYKGNEYNKDAMKYLNSISFKK